MTDKLFDDRFFQQLNTLRLCLRVRLHQGMSGARKSSAKGASVEFSDFREYMLGDDIRRIDWNAYGRMDKLYIKQFMEEKEAIYHIFVDTSRSMTYGNPPKSRLSLQLAGALAYLVLNQLDRVYVTAVKENALSYGTGLSGRNAYWQILAALSSMTFAGKTTLTKAIRQREISGSGCSILISDFLDPAGIEPALRYLKYKKQQIVLIQVLAEEELCIRDEGSRNLIDCETGEIVRATMNRSTIATYQKQLEAFQMQLARLAKKYEAVYIVTGAASPVDKVLFDGLQKAGLVVSK